MQLTLWTGQRRVRSRNGAGATWSSQHNGGVRVRSTGRLNKLAGTLGRLAVSRLHLPHSLFIQTQVQLHLISRVDETNNRARSSDVRYFRDGAAFCIVCVNVSIRVSQ